MIYGATASIRPSEVSGIESMVGLFINTLPVRVRVSPCLELVPFLKELMKNQAAREPYLYASLAHIQSISDVPPGSCLFESIFVFENYPVEEQFGQMKTKFKFSHIKGYETNNYPLTVTGLPGVNIILKISYDSDRFEGERIKRMLEHYEMILMGFLKHPSRRLSEFAFLSESENQKILSAYNRSGPGLKPARSEYIGAYVAPVNRTQIRLAAIWENVLDVKKAGIKDNFFEFGGHSLIAVRLMANIEMEFGVKIPLPALFDSPTIEHLASILDSETRNIE